MSKNNLRVGIIYVFLGCILAIYSISQAESKLNALLFGFAFALIPPGLMMIVKFFYWTRPKNTLRYQEKISQEKIMLHDELQVKLRDKSGCITFLFGLLISSISIVMFSILNALDILINNRLFIIYLGVYFILQILIYLITYYKLSKRY